MDTTVLLILEGAAIVVLGLALGARTARARGGRWQALLFAVAGVVVAFALALAGSLASRSLGLALLPLFYLFPQLASHADRRHPGGRLMLGIGAAAIMALGLPGQAPLAAVPGGGERWLVLAATIPLVPFVSWWLGWGVEAGRAGRRVGWATVAATSLYLAVAALVPWASVRLWLLWTGHLLAWLAWLEASRRASRARAGHAQTTGL